MDEVDEALQTLDPASLRRAAAYLWRQAAKPPDYRLIQTEHDPFSVGDMLQGHVENAAEAERREADFVAARAADAKRQIMAALAEQERQAKQQAHREFYRTPIGRLLREQR